MYRSAVDLVGQLIQLSHVYLKSWEQTSHIHLNWATSREQEERFRYHNSNFNSFSKQFLSSMYIVTFHTATWYCIETRPPFFYLRPHTHFRCIYHGDIILSMSICCPKIILKSLYLRITKSFLSQFKIDTLVESFVRKAWKHGSEIKSFFKITFCPF